MNCWFRMHTFYIHLEKSLWLLINTSVIEHVLTGKKNHWSENESRWEYEHNILLKRSTNLLILDTSERHNCFIREAQFTHWSLYFVTFWKHQIKIWTKSNLNYQFLPKWFSYLLLKYKLNWRQYKTWEINTCGAQHPFSWTRSWSAIYYT